MKIAATIIWENTGTSRSEADTEYPGEWLVDLIRTLDFEDWKRIAILNVIVYGVEEGK